MGNPKGEVGRSFIDKVVFGSVEGFLNGIKYPCSVRFRYTSFHCKEGFFVGSVGSHPLSLSLTIFYMDT